MILSIDIETYSSVDLTESNVYTYSGRKKSWRRCTTSSCGHLKIRSDKP